MKNYYYYVVFGVIILLALFYYRGDSSSLRQPLPVDQPVTVLLDSVRPLDSYTVAERYEMEMSEIVATRDIVIDAKKQMERHGVVDKNLALFLNAELEKQNSLLSLRKYQNLKADRDLYFKLYSEKEAEFYKQYPYLK